MACGSFVLKPSAAARTPCLPRQSSPCDGPASDKNIASNSYVKGRRLHDPQDITSIKLDDTLKRALEVDAFKVANFAKVLDGALEIAPNPPVQFKYRLSLSSMELKPTVVDVTISVASERVYPIHDSSQDCSKIDLEIQHTMQKVALFHNFRAAVPFPSLSLLSVVVVFAGARGSVTLSNYVELCRTMLNYVELCVTISN